MVNGKGLNVGKFSLSHISSACLQREREMACLFQPRQTDWYLGNILLLGRGRPVALAAF